MEDGKRVMEEQPKYLAEAKYLAESYTHMLELRRQLKARIDGDWTYTKEMAIADLDNISVSYDGERVQSSNISNPTERIAMKLTDRYMAKKQEEMYRERDALVREVDYLDWKIEVVESAVTGRMERELEHPVFTLIYKGHKTFREAERILLKKRKLMVSNKKIVKMKGEIWRHLSEELEFCDALERERPYVERLGREAEENVET